MSANRYTTEKLQTKLNTNRRYNDQTTRKKKYGNRVCRQA